MPKISLDGDYSFELSIKLDPKGEHEVPQQTLVKWKKAQEAWEAAQEEMSLLRNIVAEKDQQATIEKQAKKDEALAALVNEAFNASP